MKLNRNFILSCFLLLSPSSYSNTVSYEKFNTAPVFEVCNKQSTLVAQLLKARDNGLPLERARALSGKEVGGEPFPAQTIEDIYTYSLLPPGGHYGYFLWSCQAKHVGLAPLPLSSVVEDLQACFNRDGKDPCAKAIRNRVAGFDNVQ